jgi:hypothetical protein
MSLLGCRSVAVDGAEVLRQTLDDCSHYLDADRPMTDIVRKTLRAATE